MLPEVEGTLLHILPWGSKFRPERAVEWRHGPPAVLQTDGDGRTWLAWLSDRDEDTERWIFLALGPDGLARALAGETGIPEILANAGDGFIVVADVDPDDRITHAVAAYASRLSPDYYPARIQEAGQPSRPQVPA